MIVAGRIQAPTLYPFAGVGTCGAARCRRQASWLARYISPHSSPGIVQRRLFCPPRPHLGRPPPSHVPNNSERASQMSLLIRTVTHYYVGEVAENPDDRYVALTKASWVPDTGRFLRLFEPES